MFQGQFDLGGQGKGHQLKKSDVTCQNQTNVVKI